MPGLNAHAGTYPGGGVEASGNVAASIGKGEYTWPSNPLTEDFDSGWLYAFSGTDQYVGSFDSGWLNAFGGTDQFLDDFESGWVLTQDFEGTDQHVESFDSGWLSAFGGTGQILDDFEGWS